MICVVLSNNLSINIKFNIEKCDFIVYNQINGDEMKNILKNYIDFYKKNLKVKHIVCSIIAIIIFGIFLVSNIYEYSTIENLTYEKIGYFDAIKENTLLAFVIIFAGITPYFFLSVLGFVSMYSLANRIAIMYLFSKSIIFLIVLIMFSIICAIAYSLCIATGIYYCILSSKRFSYSQKKGFRFSDLKGYIYKLRRNEEKLKAYEENKKEEMKKVEKLNVKIPYINFIISLVFCLILISLVTIIVR